MVVGVAVVVRAGVAVGIGVETDGSITTRTMKAPKVLGLVTPLRVGPQNDLLVLVELSNSRVFLGVPVVAITTPKLPETVRFRLETSKLFHPAPIPTVDVVDVDGVSSPERSGPVTCIVRLSPAVYHA